MEVRCWWLAEVQVSAMARCLFLEADQVQVLEDFLLPYILVYAHFQASKIVIKKQGRVWYTNL